MREARSESIHPNRALRFAFLYATAERLTQGVAVSKEHTRRSKVELAGEIHGLQTGYRDNVEATQRYHRGRRARQQVKASHEALLGKWRAFKEVVQKHRSELPVHVQPRFSDAVLTDVGKKLQNMGISIVLDEDDLVSKKGGQREHSEVAQTYIWWCLKLPLYRGKWNDMHRLAVAWRMSPSSSEKGFRNVVKRICKGAPCPHRFEKSWESLLSEKV